MSQPIQRALLSVSDKRGIVELAKYLVKHNIMILSTGGTAKTLVDAGIAVTDVAEHTGFPEMMDGRVKTLHPTIHGGLLALRDNHSHVQSLEDHDIATIDLVVVNLYPFEETVAKALPFAETVEQIDIGGPSMVRSAAKNHRFVTVITDPNDYPDVIAHLEAHQCTPTTAFKQRMAAKAFARTARYDSAIEHWFATQEDNADAPLPERLSLPAHQSQSLRYGENPHQHASFYPTLDTVGIGSATTLQGKPLSYNNIHDANAALELVACFDQPASVIVKHANPCGVALGSDIETAYANALACDPTSAFGGILAFNRTITTALAEAISTLFTEVIIAPAIDDDAAGILAKKPRTRLLILPEMDQVHHQTSLDIRTVSGGFLAQERDTRFVTMDQVECVTKCQPTDADCAELLFAFRVCKYVKSNAIVLTNNMATIGIGAGQMSRVDAANIAIQKAEAGEGRTTHGSCLASDAFFPFADSVESAARAGIRAIIQPGGSIRDQEVIDAADKHGIAMLVTHMRHFKH